MIIFSDLLKKILSKIRLYMRRFSDDRFSASDVEVKYWKKAGLKKGADFYESYLNKFGVEASGLLDKSIGDLGCGPFGGMVSFLQAKEVYPIDILAEVYNEWRQFPERCGQIYKFDGKKTSLPDAIIDVLFCCNMIDHTRHPEYIVQETYRILKKGGILYLHVHLRRKKELNRAHPTAWSEKFLENIFKKGFEVEWHKVENSDEVNKKEYKTLYAKMVKR